MNETISQVPRTTQELVRKLGRAPSPEEVAKQMELSVAKIREVTKIEQEPLSLQTPVGEDEESHLGDLIEDKTAMLSIPTVVASEGCQSGLRHCRYNRPGRNQRRYPHR